MAQSQNDTNQIRVRDLPERERPVNRLREVGRKAFLTFKGAPQKSRRFKVREEFETEVRNGRELRRILRSLGLVAGFRYAKHRTVFRKGAVKICLDETAVGHFAELEGERSDIVKLAKTLGFSPARMIKRDYVAAYRYLSPAYQAVVTEQQYQAKFGRVLEWRLAKAKDIHYDSPTLASVSVEVTYRVHPPGVQGEMIETSKEFSEKWLYKDGGWWYTVQ